MSDAKVMIDNNYNAACCSIREKVVGAQKGDNSGFDASNLCKMRKFYLCFPKQDALRPELSWHIIVHL